MRIAVLGGGHGCYAAAADLALQGHEVRLWRRNAEALALLAASGTITLKDFAGRRDVKIALATADIGAAVHDADLLLSPSPAFAQHDIARALAPHLREDQIVFLPPGTFGSFVMAQAVRAAGCDARIAFAETGTLPYLTRKHGPAEVAITIRAKRLPTGVYPANRARHAIDVIRQAYPSVEPVEDALSGALMNAGPIIHPPLILMNAGPLELFANPGAGGFTKRVPASVLALGGWDIHNEGTQASIRRVTDTLTIDPVNRLSAQRDYAVELRGLRTPAPPRARPGRRRRAPPPRGRENASAPPPAGRRNPWSSWRARRRQCCPDG